MSASRILSMVLPALIALQLGLVHAASAQTQTADYQIVFDASWSALTHPNEFPNGPHFSPLVGGTHNANVVFWEPGTLASPGIELMSETGNTSTFRTEINDEISTGHADQNFVGSGINSPGSTSITINVDQSFPELTLVSMLAPSPDWFVGVHGLPLFDDGWWVPEIVVDLFTYDAGTDLGVTYESANADANPALPISLQGFPLEIGVPVGTFTITRLPEPGTAIQLLMGAPWLMWLYRRRSHKRELIKASDSPFLRLFPRFFECAARLPEWAPLGLLVRMVRTGGAEKAAYSAYRPRASRPDSG